jgi:hypothetical protein
MDHQWLDDFIEAATDEHGRETCDAMREQFDGTLGSLRELVAAVKATDATQHTRHIHELAAEIDRELNPQQPDAGRKE